MSKKQIEATKLLPGGYVQDSTVIIEFEDIVLAINEKLPTIAYGYKGANFWREVTVEHIELSEKTEYKVKNGS